jgi:hypothetical protein
MIKLLLVGSNPSSSSPTDDAFDCSTCSRKVINSWLSSIDLVNADIVYINVHNKPTIGNRPLSIKEIKSTLISLKHELDKFSDYKIIALGNTANKALTLLHSAFYAMPHPSGRNRKLNDLMYVKEKLRGLKTYIESPYTN